MCIVGKYQKFTNSDYSIFSANQYNAAENDTIQIAFIRLRTTAVAETTTTPVTTRITRISSITDVESWVDELVIMIVTSCE